MGCRSRHPSVRSRLRGSDTLATARALSAALHREGPFDLVLVGRNTIDGDTGQVGPEVAELCDLPFATGVRELALDGRRLDLRLEHDDGWQQVSLELPAVLSVAERLCEPCKVPPEGRAGVDAALITLHRASDLGPGPWGQEGSPTVVGSVRTHPHDRVSKVLEGTVAQQVAEAMAMLETRGALSAGLRPETGAEELAELAVRSVVDGSPAVPSGRVVATIVEPGRPQVARELTGAARRLAVEVGVESVAIECGAAASTPTLAVDRVRSSWSASRCPKTSPMQWSPGAAKSRRGWCSHPVPPSAVRWPPVPRRPSAPVWWATPSAWTWSTGCWWRPNPHSRGRWWPTSRAPRVRNW